MNKITKTRRAASRVKRIVQCSQAESQTTPVSLACVDALHMCTWQDAPGEVWSFCGEDWGFQQLLFLHTMWSRSFTYMFKRTACYLFIFIFFGCAVCLTCVLEMSVGSAATIDCASFVPWVCVAFCGRISKGGILFLFLCFQMNKISCVRSRSDSFKKTPGRKMPSQHDHINKCASWILPNANFAPTGTFPASVDHTVCVFFICFCKIPGFASRLLSVFMRE